MTDWLATLPPACECLRDYQLEQIGKIRTTLAAGHRRMLVQLPTGGGKTHEIGAVTAGASAAGLRVLILATRTRLVRQLHERLQAFGVPHGVIAAQLRGLTYSAMTVQVASIDTLYRRCLVDQKRPLPGADVVIFDEGHLAIARTRAAVLEQYKHAPLFGFTATPARPSGKPLRNQFDVLLPGKSVAELIAMGILVRPRIFNVPVVTTRELEDTPKDADGDYQIKALGNLLSRPKLIGNVVENWLKIAAGKRTLIFATNKAHGESLVEQFGRVGVVAESLTDDDTEKTREAVTARLEAGETTIVVNCFLLSYGVDIPSVECIVLARPTRSLVLYLQTMGRGLRTAPGKEACILIDHGRVVENLGLPTDRFEWSLVDRSNVNDRAREQIERSRVSETEKQRTCPECQYVWKVSEEGNSCSNCGWQLRPRPEVVPTVAAELKELGGAAPAVSPYDEAAVEFYTEALAWCARRKAER
jgi:superfamily II DNA or RNA helicase